MSNNDKVVTDQGHLGKPRSGSDAGDKAGPARSRASYCGTKEATHQAFECTATGEVKEIDPTKRKSSLNRTPPETSRCKDIGKNSEVKNTIPSTVIQRARTSSLGELDNIKIDLTIEQPTKRKRTNIDSPDLNKDKIENSKSDLIKNINALMKHAAAMTKLVETNKNPKNEMKELANKMNNAYLELKKSEALNLKWEPSKEPIQKEDKTDEQNKNLEKINKKLTSMQTEIDKIKQENSELKKKMQKQKQLFQGEVTSLEEENIKLKNEIQQQKQLLSEKTNNPQTISNENKITKTYYQLKENITIEKFKSINSKEWDNKNFVNIKIKIGNPIYDEEHNVSVIIKEPDDPNLEKSIQKIYKDRFPEIKNVKEEFEILEQIIRTKSGVNRSIKKIIITKYNGSLEDAWNVLTKIRSEIEDTDNLILIKLIK
ncbi:hypothetical protein ABEB36_015559 [Hypothenemus hampei]|uniref:Uncharacterized protein n=1 Tax=Hypothenemus hampei TaxID=57062 RepID=A0ABD1E257_HYPHA